MIHAAKTLARWVDDRGEVHAALNTFASRVEVYLETENLMCGHQGPFELAVSLRAFAQVKPRRRCPGCWEHYKAQFVINEVQHALD